MKAIIDDAPLFPDAVIRVSSQPNSMFFESTTTKNAADWERLSELEQCAASIAWNDHSPNSIDALALPQSQYVQHFNLRGLLGIGEINHDGTLSTEGDILKVLATVSDETAVTLAIVHC